MRRFSFVIQISNSSSSGSSLGGTLVLQQPLWRLWRLASHYLLPHVLLLQGLLNRQNFERFAQTLLGID